ncbi:hypothetical protein WR25_21282 [Diploscapter pachys]|uniref:Uncharacterized protein n=1 Tax=Diploscapter pachys TaxID=2018661 RepID=A0A2A2M4C6_9BILA|nr:hypothetical protein WR25_21282 [Diploscapter pachys]
MVAQQHPFGLFDAGCPGDRVVGFAALENHQQALAATGFVLVRLDQDAYPFGMLVEVEGNCARRYRLAAALGLQQGTAQGRTQRREDQVEQVVAELAAGMAQIAPHALAHVQDIALGIDHQARRRAAGEGSVMDFGIGQFAGGACPGRRRSERRLGGLQARRMTHGRHFTGAEDAVALVHGDEQPPGRSAKWNRRRISRCTSRSR